MSRIGKTPVSIPAGVTVTVDKNNIVTVKGKNGTLYQKINSDGISLEINEAQVLVKCATNQKRHKSMHGLYRQLIHNMCEGVSVGFKKELLLHGVGFRAKIQGQLLELLLGYSHPIMFLLPDEVKATVQSERGQDDRLVLTCHDKQLLGQVAAKIRSFRKPSAYLSKHKRHRGVRYSDEFLRTKAGKTASK
ncbi:MAG: 50S ribosomal protein L6 [Saprospiraceae bacterium]|nr:50S ribosomal protein L6 [Saprospiraceae bacterium]